MLNFPSIFLRHHRLHSCQYAACCACSVMHHSAEESWPHIFAEMYSRRTAVPWGLLCQPKPQRVTFSHEGLYMAVWMIRGKLHVQSRKLQP